MPIKKIDYQKLEKKIKLERISCWEKWGDNMRKKAFSFAEGYKDFINKAKTEREAVKEAVVLLRRAGAKELMKAKSLKPGDIAYADNRGKSLMAARIGRKGLDNGFRLVMGHIDAPHLDLKVSPLYEDEGLALFKTHYYGGIKKYQWTTIALALHGVVYLKNGKSVEFVIGEHEDDPVFMITDLLPHLDRAGGPGSPIKNREVKAEDLNLVIGSLPINDEKVKEKVKLAVLEHLHNEYGVEEEDFASAEISAVPSEKARDLGFDRSMIAAYGHDDRICSYAGLKAFLDSDPAQETQVIILIDREEIGSEGATGAQSTFIEMAVSRMQRLIKGASSIDKVYEIFSMSRGISADVSAALDPDYKEVHDVRNAQKLGYGLSIERYTGSGGKYNTSEASGSYISELRALFSKNSDILYQISGGLGKVDEGGGGTIAKYIANRNVDIVDMGIPLLNMHAPLEIASKADLYCAYLGFKAFFGWKE